MKIIIVSIALVYAFFAIPAHGAVVLCPVSPHSPCRAPVERIAQEATTSEEKDIAVPDIREDRTGERLERAKIEELQKLIVQLQALIDALRVRKSA